MLTPATKAITRMRMMVMVGRLPANPSRVHLERLKGSAAAEGKRAPQTVVSATHVTADFPLPAPCELEVRYLCAATVRTSSSTYGAPALDISLIHRYWKSSPEFITWDRPPQSWRG
jgi:hypothetical protein